MSNVGKFLFDLCNEFSINILLLKLAADSCRCSRSHSLAHRVTHTHTSAVQFHLLLWQCIQFCFGFGSRTCPNAFYSCLSASAHVFFVTGSQSWQLISTNGRQEVHFCTDSGNPDCQQWCPFWGDFKHALKHNAERLRYAHVHTSHIKTGGGEGRGQLGKLFIIPISLPRLVQAAEIDWVSRPARPFARPTRSIDTFIELCYDMKYLLYAMWCLNT